MFYPEEALGTFIHIIFIKARHISHAQFQKEMGDIPYHRPTRNRKICEQQIEHDTESLWRYFQQFELHMYMQNDCLYQGSAHYDPWAKTTLPPEFINNV